MGKRKILTTSSFILFSSRRELQGFYLLLLVLISLLFTSSRSFVFLRRCCCGFDWMVPLISLPIEMETESNPSLSSLSLSLSLHTSSFSFLYHSVFFFISKRAGLMDEKNILHLKQRCASVPSAPPPRFLIFSLGGLFPPSIRVYNSQYALHCIAFPSYNNNKKMFLVLLCMVWDRCEMSVFAECFNKKKSSGFVL